VQARQDLEPAPKICFHGVEQASPFGSLLRSAVAAMATVSSLDRTAPTPSRWLAAVAATKLQWWQSEGPARTSARGARAVDIAVDFFGAEPVGNFTGRFWRVVDESGEAILNPFCFLEKCCRAPFVASIFLIERAASDVGWTVIGEAHISNRLEYGKLLDRVGQVAAHLVASALSKCGYSAGKPWQATMRAPVRSSMHVAAGQLRVRVSKAALTMRHVAFSERWGIGLLRAPIDALTRSQFVRADAWVQSPSRDAFLADPFPWPGRSNMFLCERYDFRTHIGVIRAITLDAGTIADDQPLDLHVGDTHLSYPGMYRENGRTYLLPEMAASKELILFELTSEGEAQPVAVIDKGTQIADPTLFAHAGFYWIAYTDLGFGTDDNLCLLYSKRLEGPWLPHSLNPVKIDVRSSRPGGLPFSQGGMLYRPAQDCSTTYGAALALNLIRVCTPSDYEEELVAVLKPDPRGPFPHGLHTLAIDEARILIDGKRVFFDARRVAKWMNDKLRRFGRGE
jgi:hypothetical protein